MARREQNKAKERPSLMNAGVEYGNFEARGVAPIADSFGADNSSVSDPDEVALVRRATEVLGVEHVARWMQSSIPSLDHRSPYALISTAEGRKQVERVLLKIEHGVY